MHPLSTHRGLCLLLLLVYISLVQAQQLPNASVALHDPLRDRSAWEEVIEQQHPGQNGTEREHVGEQPKLEGQRMEVISIVATTYLQPRPTAPPLSAVNPTRVNGDEDEHDEQQEREMKLLPAAPPRRKRKRDQAANIFRTLAHLASLRPLLTFLFHAPLHLFRLLRAIYYWSLPLTSYLLAPLLWALSLFLAPFLALFNLIASPFRLAWRLFFALRPLIGFALLAVLLGAGMGVLAAVVGGAGVVPKEWRWVGGQKLGGRTPEEVFREEQGKEARWERRSPPRSRRARAGMDDDHHHHEEEEEYITTTTTTTTAPHSSTTAPHSSTAASTSTRSRSAASGSGGSTLAGGEEGKVQRWRSSEQSGWSRGLPEVGARGRRV